MTANELHHIAKIIVPTLNAPLQSHNIETIKNAISNYLSAKHKAIEYLNGSNVDIITAQPFQQQVQSTKSNLELTVGSQKSNFLGMQATLSNIKDPVVQKYLSEDGNAADMLYALINDLPGLINGTNQFKLESVEKLFFKINILFRIHDALEAAGVPVDKQYLSNQDSIDIIFEDDNSITKLSEFSKAAQAWKVTINGIARLVNEHDTDVEILSVRRGSLILTIVAATPVIFGIANIVIKINKMRLSFLQVEELKQKMKGMNMSLLNDAVDLIDKSAKINLSQKSEQIAREVEADYDLKNDNPDYGEIHSFVCQSVKNIIKFTNKGGQVETRIIPRETTTEQQMATVSELNQTNMLIKSLEKKIAEIDNGRQVTQLLEDNEESDA